MREEARGTVQACSPTTSDGFAEMLGVPINDDRGEQVQPGHPEVLPFAGAVADFALAANLRRRLPLRLCWMDRGTKRQIHQSMGPIPLGSRWGYPRGHAFLSAQRADRIAPQGRIRADICDDPFP